MPEYLAPGVFVEEVSFRAKSIEGVSTSTCGFVGPTRKGPLEGTPELLTNFADDARGLVLQLPDAGLLAHDAFLGSGSVGTVDSGLRRAGFDVATP